MALVPCPECQKEVSSVAAACPNCGHPIAGGAEAQAVHMPLVTTQATSKHLKKALLTAWALFIVGLIFIFSGGGTGKEASAAAPSIGLILMISGIALWIGTRFQIWWHHK